MQTEKKGSCNMYKPKHSKKLTDRERLACSTMKLFAACLVCLVYWCGRSQAWFIASVLAIALLVLDMVQGEKEAA